MSNKTPDFLKTDDKIISQFSEDGELEVQYSGRMPEWLRHYRTKPLEEVTDRQLVMELVRRLGLKPAERVGDTYFMSDDDYTIMENNDIVIGRGNGYSRFYTRFNFDGDKLTGHGVWE